ncbi:hypothetical protein [Embleya sp. MST-111070]|uniref:hypothetical protein n=1 Tax=Embleya sp. MST-111070 TaxID=3398231 RepID=UPI003F73C080
MSVPIVVEIGCGGRTRRIPQLKNSGRVEGNVQLAGLITGIQRRVTKNGSPWAMINLALAAKPYRTVGASGGLIPCSISPTRSARRLCGA